jgi:hypothetical protein
MKSSINEYSFGEKVVTVRLKRARIPEDETSYKQLPKRFVPSKEYRHLLQGNPFIGKQ